MKPWVWPHRQVLAEATFAAECSTPWERCEVNPLDGAGVFSGPRWPRTLAEHVAMGDGASGEEQHSFPVAHARGFDSASRGRMLGFRKVSFQLAQTRVMLSYRFLYTDRFARVKVLAVAVDGSRVPGRERPLMFFVGKNIVGHWCGCWASPLDIRNFTRYQKEQAPQRSGL